MIAAAGPALAECSPAAPCTEAPQSITPPESLTSSAASVSADGTVVVGQARGNWWQAIGWTRTGTTDLGTLGGRNAYAYGVSADGKVIVGAAEDADRNDRAFRWTAVGGMQDLGTLGGSYASAYGVNADGSVVVGESDTSRRYNRAFRWTAAGGMIDLGTLGGTLSKASAVNADGSVVVGVAWTSGDLAAHAFRWTSTGGMADLGTLGGGRSHARAVSADGSVVVGESITSEQEFRAFRWTSAGMVSLGTLGGNQSNAQGVSGDGSIVVGSSATGSGTSAFRWTAASGMRDLNELLKAAGVNMSGISLTTANAISADGRFIVGAGVLPGSNSYQGYIVKYADSEPVGLVTPGAVQTSVDGLSNTLRGAGAQQHGFASPLLGKGSSVGTDTSSAGAYGSAGSVAAGSYGRYAFGGGFQVLGGLAYAQEDYANATLNHALMGALAARWVAPGFGDLKPFAEGGGWYAPNTAITLERTYANGAGTATGTGRSHADMSYLFGRAGLAWAIGRGCEIALSAELGRQRMALDAYSESLDNNPFNAISAGGTEQMRLAKLGLQYTMRMTETMDASFYVSGVRSYGAKTDLSATVIGIGTMTAAAPADTRWVELGARVGTKLTQSLTLDVFADSIAGRDGVGTTVHVGAGLRVAF
jgi:probable HAF family extracellular repeat protein